MGLKGRRKPKIQRGLSMTQELAAAIQADADKLGKTWNEVAESALNRVFLSPSHLQNTMQNSNNSPATGGVDWSDTDD